MKKTIYTCDHCGAELDPMVDFTECEMQINGEHIEFDLCQYCIEELENLCRDFLSGNHRKRIIAGEKHER